MDRKLHLLDSFVTVGTDGAHHKVRVYEHLVDDPSLPGDGREHWEPVGLLEYRLDDGRALEMADDDHWRVRGGGLELHRAGTAATVTRRRSTGTAAAKR